MSVPDPIGIKLPQKKIKDVPKSFHYSDKELEEEKCESLECPCMTVHNELLAAFWIYLSLFWLALIVTILKLNKNKNSKT